MFSNLKAKGAVVRAPVIDVLRKHRREVILIALLRTGQQVPFYIFTTYIITYATSQLGGLVLRFVYTVTYFRLLSAGSGGYPHREELPISCL